jgi:hypothetical protein
MQPLLDWAVVGRVLSLVLELNGFDLLEPMLLDPSLGVRIALEYGELLISKLLLHSELPCTLDCLVLLFRLLPLDRLTESLLDLPWDEDSSRVILTCFHTAGLPLDPRLPPSNANCSPVRSRRLLSSIK